MVGLYLTNSPVEICAACSGCGIPGIDPRLGIPPVEGQVPVFVAPFRMAREIVLSGVNLENPAAQGLVHKQVVKQMEVEEMQYAGDPIERFALLGVRCAVNKIRGICRVDTEPVLPPPVQAELALE